MIKKHLLKGLAGLMLGLMFSCDNTTADPLNQNNPNNNSGGSGTTGPTITGPRILHKIVVNNETTEEYVTTGNILQKAIIREESGPNSFLVGTATYTSGKITKVKIGQEVNGAVPTNAVAYDFNITYDSSGKVNYTTCQTTLGGAQHFYMEYTYTYDGSGKITKIIEKKKAGAIYTHFTNSIITNTGDNITKVTTESGITNDSGVPDMSNVVTVEYNFSAYDTKINPYTTLPKTFFLMYGLLHTANFYLLSANNVKTFSFAFPPVLSVPTPATGGNYTYIYDSMNYPTSDQGQVKKYIYKAL